MTQKSIYEQLIGEDFNQLHPKIQARYSKPPGTPFVAEGVMHQIMTGAKWMSPLYKAASRFQFLLPEGGENIPFKIRSVLEVLPNGEAVERWERAFYFQDKTHHFKSFMTVDHTHTIAKDHFGDPNLANSELHFSVTKEGRLIIRTGAQYMAIGNVNIPLPRNMQGIGLVEEGYDDVKGTHTIHLSIHNPIFGQLMAYSGEFKEIIEE